MKTYGWIEKLFDGFEENARGIVILAALFLSGIIIGAAASVNLSDAGIGSVSEYMDCFFSDYALHGVNKGDTCRASIISNMKCLIFMCLPLFSPWFIPFLAVQLGLKGFKMGFTIGFLSHIYGASGAAIGFFSLFWQLLFTLPVLFLCGARIIGFSVRLGGSIKGFSRFKNISSRVYTKLIAALLLTVLVIIAGGLFDGYAATVITLSLCGILEI